MEPFAVNLEQSFEEKRREIEKYEEGYNLPPMLGTERQRLWARIIRREFLIEIFTGLMDATANRPEGEAQAIYGCLNKLRAENNAKPWIEKMKTHLGAAIPFLLALPAAEAAAAEQRRQVEEAKLERQRKSREAIAEIKSAGVFERQHRLPDLISDANSTKQQNWGRRCRLRLLQEMDENQIEAIREYLNKQTEAVVWIAAFTNGLCPTEMVIKYPLKECAVIATVTRPNG